MFIDDVFQNHIIASVAHLLVFRMTHIIYSVFVNENKKWRARLEIEREQDMPYLYRV
jgi:hypothetical protein